MGRAPISTFIRKFALELFDFVFHYGRKGEATDIGRAWKD